MSKNKEAAINPLQNLWMLPEGYAGNPEGYLAETVRKYGDVYGLLERGRELLFRSARTAYQEAGVFGNGISITRVEDLPYLSSKVDTNVILEILKKEDPKAHALIRDLLSDTKPINEVIQRRNAVTKETSNAQEGKSTVFSRAKCPSCGGDANIFVQGLSALETGTPLGGFLVSFSCKTGCKASPVQYLVANSEACAVYGKLSDINDAPEKFMPEPDLNKDDAELPREEPLDG